ncbi:MAG TPA: class I SAM-dependent methyltransferase [Bacteroidia bacterium]|nr:class I SAM-dependent methyltransferase [Bacteroidia bacterium]HNT79533.1 class I SAM-dependent methyltransferase [Bacteroidia bacterium]
MPGTADKLLFIVKSLIQRPFSIRNLFDEEQYHKLQLRKANYSLKGFPQIDMENVWGLVENTVSEFLFLEGGSSILDLVLLQKVCSSIPNCHYLEIGTWRGESAAAVAPYCKKVVTVNLGCDELKQAGMSDEYIKSQGFLSKNINHVEHIKANSLEYDFEKLNSKFDVIFIDGDHHYESVVNDTKKLLPLLRNENSIMVWHDYGLSEERIRFTVYRGILDSFRNEMRSNLYHVANTKCAVYANIQSIVKPLLAFNRPEKSFTVQLKSKKI